MLEIKTARQDDDLTSAGKAIKTFHIIFADLDRYASDKYDFELFLRETKSGYSIGCCAFHSHIGVAVFTRYWHYKENELNIASKTFEKIKDVAMEVRDDIEYNKKPPATISGMLFHYLANVDSDHRESCGVPSINYSRSYLREPDFRESIYGYKYPEPIIENKINNLEQQRKEMVIENSGRNKEYKFKNV